MNYLEQIVAFHRWKRVHQLPGSAIALWFELMATCNEAAWEQDFTISNAVLQASAGLSRREFEHARQLLISMGRITYKKSLRVNQAGNYTINPLPFVRNVQQNEQQNVQQKVPIVRNVQRNVQREGQQEVQRYVHGARNGTYNGDKTKQNDLEDPDHNNNPPIVPPLPPKDREQFIREYEAATGKKLVPGSPEEEPIP